MPLQAFAGFECGELHRPYRYLATHAAQVEAGAVFMEASQWLRPDHYPLAQEGRAAAVAREMAAVRSAVALFEASPLGKLRVVGPDAAKFLEHVYVTALASLKVGRIRYGVMADEHGVVVDDGVVLREGDDAFVLSPSSGMVGHVASTLREWLQCEWRDWDVAVQDLTAQSCTVALAGPKARDLLHRLGTELDVSAQAFPHMSFRDGEVAGLACRVARVSFTGELQFEVSVPAAQGEGLWRRTLAAAQAMGGCAVGAEAWLQLRLDKGYILVGVDTDGTTTPDDIGFTRWREKSADFIGRRSLTRSAALAQDRLQLVGLQGGDRDLLLPVGAQVVGAGRADGAALKSAGRVTSSRVDPGLGSIALGLVEAGRRRLGEAVELIGPSGERLRAHIAAPQVYDPTGARLDG